MILFVSHLAYSKANCAIKAVCFREDAPKNRL